MSVEKAPSSSPYNRSVGVSLEFKGGQFIVQAFKSCCYELELQLYLLHLLQRLFVIRRAAAWSQWFSSCLVMPPAAPKGRSALLHGGSACISPMGLPEPLCSQGISLQCSRIGIHSSVPRANQ